MSFNVGEMVGPYRIIEQLGQGGMATVYKAYHAALDRYVALKVLHPAFLEDKNFLSRFQREARLVAKLDHPNIVPIFDYAEHEGRPYLVMKFIEGETLKARLARGPVSREEIGKVVDAVGMALAFAHKFGILHRDIKPSNVLLAEDGQIYLADFGLARIAQSGESTLTSDMILGTPQYISPEQAIGKKDLDEGTDIYSFGVMLYELTVGKVPFSADTPFSIIHDHIYSPLPMPRQINPDVSLATERVLLKALAKERNDRYKDITALIEAFRQAWKEDVPSESSEAKTPSVEVPAKVAPPPPPVQSAPPPPTIMPVPAPAAKTPVPAPVEAVQKPEPRRRKVKWMWLAVGVILILGCLVTFSALLSIRRLAGSTVPQLVKTFVPFQTPGTILDIAQAEQYANQHPDDPNAYLQLALAYTNANLPESAQEAVTNLEEMGAADEGFYWDAGHQLAQKGAWLVAAQLYMDAAELRVQACETLSDDLRNQLHEAIYKAFKDETAPDYISSDRLAAIDDPMGVISKALYTFYYGDKVNAQDILDRLMQDKPGMPEAQLLQAEFSAKVGDIARARKALTDLRANPNAAVWLLTEANSIEGTLP